MPRKLVEMRTDNGRTFGLEVVYKNHSYLYVEGEDTFYDNAAGIPKITDEAIIKKLKDVYEKQK